MVTPGAGFGLLHRQKVQVEKAGSSALSLTLSPTALRQGPLRALPGFRDQSVSTTAFSQRVAPVAETLDLPGNQKWRVKFLLLMVSHFFCLVLFSTKHLASAP